MSKKPFQKSSTSLNIREMKIKTTLRFPFTPVKMAIIKITNDKKNFAINVNKGTITNC